MNCTAVRCGDDMILIDAGVTFPGNGPWGDLGVEVIVPDISFLKENQEQLKAILLTHGHEDHAGGVAYIVDEIPVPVYGSRLTLGLVSARLKEHNLDKAVQLVPLQARECLQFGSLTGRTAPHDPLLSRRILFCHLQSGGTVHLDGRFQI